MSKVDLTWLFGADDYIHNFAQPAYGKAAENIAIIISCTCICVHAGLQGSLRQLRSRSVSPVLLAPSSLSPILGHWGLACEILLEFFACFHMVDVSPSTFEIAMPTTHLIHNPTYVSNTSLPLPRCIRLSILGQHFIGNADDPTSGFPSLSHVDLW